MSEIRTPGKAYTPGRENYSTSFTLPVLDVSSLVDAADAEKEFAEKEFDLREASYDRIATAEDALTGLKFMRESDAAKFQELRESMGLSSEVLEETIKRGDVNEINALARKTERLMSQPFVKQVSMANETYKQIQENLFKMDKNSQRYTSELINKYRNAEPGFEDIMSIGEITNQVTAIGDKAYVDGLFNSLGRINDIDHEIKDGIAITTGRKIIDPAELPALMEQVNADPRAKRAVNAALGKSYEELDSEVTAEDLALLGGQYSESIPASAMNRVETLKDVSKAEAAKARREVFEKSYDNSYMQRSASGYADMLGIPDDKLNEFMAIFDSALLIDLGFLKEDADGDLIPQPTTPEMEEKLKREIVSRMGGSYTKGNSTRYSPAFTYVNGSRVKEGKVDFELLDGLSYGESLLLAHETGGGRILVNANDEGYASIGPHQFRKEGAVDFLERYYPNLAKKYSEDLMREGGISQEVASNLLADLSNKRDLIPNSSDFFRGMYLPETTERFQDVFGYSPEEPIANEITNPVILSMSVNHSGAGQQMIMDIAKARMDADPELGLNEALTDARIDYINGIQRDGTYGNPRLRSSSTIDQLEQRYANELFVANNISKFRSGEMGKAGPASSSSKPPTTSDLPQDDLDLINSYRKNPNSFQTKSQQGVDTTSQQGVDTPSQQDVGEETDDSESSAPSIPNLEKNENDIEVFEDDIEALENEISEIDEAIEGAKDMPDLDEFGRPNELKSDVILELNKMKKEAEEAKSELENNIKNTKNNLKQSEKYWDDVLDFVKGLSSKKPEKLKGTYYEVTKSENGGKYFVRNVKASPLLEEGRGFEVNEEELRTLLFEKIQQPRYTR